MNGQRLRVRKQEFLPFFPYERRIPAEARRALLERFSYHTDIAGFALILFNLVLLYRPRIIVEIGTRTAHSTNIFLAALRAVGSGMLHSVDIDPTCVHYVRRWYRKNWAFHNMSSLEFSARFNEPVDLAFIDGDHRFEAAKQDFEIMGSLLVPDGLILMHDTYPPCKQYEGDSDLADAWKVPVWVKQTLSEEFEVCTIPKHLGLSLIRKRGSTKYF